MGFRNGLFWAVAIIATVFLQQSDAVPPCVWCDPGTQKQFLDCLHFGLSNSAPLFGVSQGVVDDVCNSLFASSGSMTKMPPSGKTHLMNDMMAGELGGLVTPDAQNSVAASDEILRITGQCYNEATNYRNTKFADEFRKQFLDSVRDNGMDTSSDGNDSLPPNPPFLPQQQNNFASEVAAANAYSASTANQQNSFGNQNVPTNNNFATSSAFSSAAAGTPSNTFSTAASESFSQGNYQQNNAPSNFAQTNNGFLSNVNLLQGGLSMPNQNNLWSLSNSKNNDAPFVQYPPLFSPVTPNVPLPNNPEPGISYVPNTEYLNNSPPEVNQPEPFVPKPYFTPQSISSGNTQSAFNDNFDQNAFTSNQGNQIPQSQPVNNSPPDVQAWQADTWNSQTVTPNNVSPSSQSSSNSVANTASSNTFNDNSYSYSMASSATGSNVQTSDVSNKYPSATAFDYNSKTTFDSAPQYYEPPAQQEPPTEDEPCPDEESEEDEENNSEAEVQNVDFDCYENDISNFDRILEETMSIAESSKYLQILTSAARACDSSYDFDNDGFTSALTSVANSIQRNHPEWSEEKSYLKTYSLSVVALSELLQEKSFPKSQF